MVGKDLDLEKIIVIDLRDYNESYTKQIEGAINIPIAYLNRHYKEIPNVISISLDPTGLKKMLEFAFYVKKAFG